MKLLSQKNDVSPTEISFNEKSIFIWIDILGFSDALEDEKRYMDLAFLLKKFQNIFNECDDYRTFIISDGIVLQITTRDVDHFKSILVTIAQKQNLFIVENNEFIRGGIAVGTKFDSLSRNKNEENNLNQIISNGLARAVKLEGNVIDWPVIGTDESNLNEIKKYFKIENETEILNLTHAYNKNGKDIYFINFITDSKAYYSILCSKIDKYQNDVKVRDKYIWLLMYYLHYYKNNDMEPLLSGVIL